MRWMMIWSFGRAYNQLVICLVFLGPSEYTVPVTAFSIDEEVRERIVLVFYPVESHEGNIPVTLYNLPERVKAVVFREVEC